MIIINKISKKLKKEEVLKDVSMEVRKGTICGVVGNNGSGKTVLFKCILGIYKIDSGEIWIDGKLMKRNSGITTGVSAIIENPAFLDNYSGLNNLKYLYELNHKKDMEHINAIMEYMGLNPKDKKKVKNYSLGMKQRLSIAQAIMDDNDLIILDEPMNGLDKNGVSDVRRILMDLKEKGKTIIIASHNPQDIEMLCDDVYEMDAGRIKKL